LPEIELVIEKLVALASGSGLFTLLRQELLHGWSRRTLPHAQSRATAAAAAFFAHEVYATVS